MPTIVPTIEQIEDYLESVEELFFASLSAASPDLPNVRQAIQRLWEDVLRHGPQALPSLPDLHIPGLGAFEVPPPPPPPPPPKSLVEKTADWLGEHKWTTAVVGISLISAGLLAGYSTLRYQQHVRTRRVVKASGSTERRQIVVVLGGDLPLGLPLILDLEKQGYIIIASVSSPEAVDDIESHCHGYVRALVLDPSEPDTVPYFLRSLSSTMSRRFPITAAGDPHASPSSYPYIHSIISLLTLPTSQHAPTPAPFEHLSLRDDYSEYLQTSHVTPLLVIQALLPLLRNSSARTRDSVSNNLGRKSIIVCLPATDARVGLPFMSAQGMSAAATLRAVEVLRREIRIAGLPGGSESMKNIKVVVVDVGTVGSQYTDTEASATEIMSSIDTWTPSERAAYGSAFASMSVHRSRKPSDVATFVRAVVDVVHDGTRRTHRTIHDLGLGFGRLREWIHGDRPVGSGARTYGLAAHLPALILDGLLILPHYLISVRNALLPIQPHVLPPQDKEKTVVPLIVPIPRSAQQHRLALEDSPVTSDQEAHEVLSDPGSDADVESNEGFGVGESWISLKEGEHSPERS